MPIKYHLAFLVLATSAMANNLTFHRPAKEGSFEVGTNLNYLQASEMYDSLRVKSSLEDDYTLKSAALYASYSITDDLEVTVAMPWMTESAPSQNGQTQTASGFGKPTIGSKISAEDLPFAAFAELALPYGSKDVVGSDPFVDILTGILMDISLPRASLRTAISYSLYPETKDKFDRGDQFQLEVMPGFKPIPELSLEAFLGYAYASETTFNGEEISPSGYTLSIGPGITYVLTDVLRAELHIPIAVAGKNTFSTQGFAIQIGYLGLGR